MKALEFIAIFLAPIVGLKILKEKKIKKEIQNYLLLILFSNLIVNLILFASSNQYYNLIFTNSFFVKYTITNIIVSFSLAYLKANFKIKLRRKK